MKMENKEEQKNNPLHGVKLADILEYLHEKYGWEDLGIELILIASQAIHPLNLA